MSRQPIEHRQVIIVGGGPAGSACAQRLAEHGLDVLIIDKRTVIGNPAQCGECIPNWGEVTSTFLGLDEHPWLQHYFDFPQRLKLHRLDHMRVFLPSGKFYEFSLDAFSGHRLQFDGHLCEKAILAGAEVRTGTSLLNLQSQRKLGRELLVTSNGRFTCDYLIDASGSLAHVARLRHGPNHPTRPTDQVPTMYAQVQGNVPPTFDVFLGSVAPSGYAWIIPKGNGFANVGLGVRAGKLKGSLKGHLDEFCKNLGFEILSYGGGWIPMGGPVKQMVDGTTLAIGDAAGLVMPSNGGGISQAIISGYFAAEAINNHLTKRTPLGEYQVTIMKALGPALKNSLRSKNLGYMFMRGDVLTECILRVLGPIGGIRRAMECDKPLWFI